MSESGLVQSIARGVDVLELLVRSESGMRLCDVAEAIGVKPPTAHSILKTMTRKRLAVKSGSRYNAGPLLRELAGLQETRFLFSAAGTALRELAPALPEADLSCADYTSGEARIVLRLRAGAAPILQQPQSLVYNPYVTASGLLFLALGDPDAVAQLQARQSFVEFGAHAWKNYDRLQDFLARTRKDELVIRPFCEAGHFAVAVPVQAPDKGLVAALGASLSGPVLTDSQRREMISRLRQAAFATIHSSAKSRKGTMA